MNHSDPVITVLMPVYNAANFLREAVESVLNQTFTNFEFLIIDDGSTDESAGIIRAFTDSRIRFLQNETNIGLTATLNKGLGLASCELIARMDADDISYPERLEKQYCFFQKNPNFVLLSNGVRYVSADKTKTRVISFNNNYIYYNLIFTCWINTPVTMYKRSVIINEGGYLTKYAEDVNLWWRISRKYKFFHDNEVLLDYRLTDTSLWKETKKEEYDQAEYRQVVENIRYYAGDDLEFTYDEIAFFRKSPGELIKKNGMAYVKACFQKFDLLNTYVFSKEKGTSRSKHIEKAAFEKKRECIKKLRKHISRTSLLGLLLQLHYWDLFLDELRRPISKKLTNQH